MERLPEPVCPRARRVEGTTAGDGGCVCTIMERDQARADPILEGAPVGVFIRAAEDPSTYFNLCAGAGEPLADPDLLAQRAFGDGHYTGCPIFCAERELTAVTERLYAPREQPETAVAAPGGSVGPEDAREAEIAWLTGGRVL